MYKSNKLIQDFKKSFEIDMNVFYTYIFQMYVFWYFSSVSKIPDVLLCSKLLTVKAMSR